MYVVLEQNRVILPIGLERTVKIVLHNVLPSQTHIMLVKVNVLYYLAR